MGYGFVIRVQGDYALFTRPEMKVERGELRCHHPFGGKGYHRSGLLETGDPLVDRQNLRTQ